MRRGDDRHGRGERHPCGGPFAHEKLPCRLCASSSSSSSSGSGPAKQRQQHDMHTVHEERRAQPARVGAQERRDTRLEAARLVGERFERVRANGAQRLRRLVKLKDCKLCIRKSQQQLVVRVSAGGDDASHGLDL
jgi:hypothetical protein